MRLPGERRDCYNEEGLRMMLPPMKVSTGVTVIICTDRAAKRGTPEYDRIAEMQRRAAHAILIDAARKRAEKR